MTHVTCKLAANNRDQLRNPTLGNRVWSTFIFFYFALIQAHHHRRGVYMDDIDGAAWLRVPPPKVTYSAGQGRLTIDCGRSV